MPILLAIAGAAVSVAISIFFYTVAIGMLHSVFPIIPAIGSEQAVVVYIAVWLMRQDFHSLSISQKS